MSEIGRINCFGFGAVPENWSYNKLPGINRLYYIEGGKGAFLENGSRREFKEGYVYFFPYTAGFDPIKSECVGMLHTYADFEMIPPVIYPRAIELAPKSNPLVDATINLFRAGGAENSPLYKESNNAFAFLSNEKERLCRSAISFIVSIASKEVGATEVSDPVVVKALESIHFAEGKELTVASLARDCFMSVDSFIRRFSKNVGMTPYAYIKGLKIRTAIYLKSVGKSLEEIAVEAGYSDASSLSHAIKSSMVESKSKG